MLDYIYESTMDGQLFRFFKVATAERFPRRYRKLEELMEDLDTRHCSRPVYLARGVATYGITEGRGCTMVLEAIEKELIVQCEEHETTVEDFDFAEFFAERNGSDADKPESP